MPADAIYPAARVDSGGKPLDGARRYVLHFDKKSLPPANAFWSLTTLLVHSWRQWAAPGALRSAAQASARHMSQIDKRMSQ
ncbi:DUF1214 domain-containing protein [Cupriavidus sp. P-10]|uniref:DUF1214 domain-containing protein n=1 Tax=Cupriavidus sp. P-10 TaxID=2027911 RepID=UPI000E2E8EB8